MDKSIITRYHSFAVRMQLWINGGLIAMTFTVVFLFFPGLSDYKFTTRPVYGSRFVAQENPCGGIAICQALAGLRRS